MGKVGGAKAWYCGCVVAFSLSLADAQPSDTTDASPAERRVEEAIERARDGDAEGGRRALEQIIDGPAWARIRGEYQHFALYYAAVFALDDDEPQHAHDVMLRVTAMPTAIGEDWHLLLFASRLSGHVDDSIRALTTLARRWPDELKAVPEDTVRGVMRDVHRSAAGTEVEVELLTALFDARWRIAVWGEPSDSWRSLALLLLERGDTRKAREVVGRITEPDVRVRARADRRFDSLVAADPAAFDVAAAAAAEVRRLEQEAALAPDTIDPLLALSTALSLSDRCADALQVVEQAIARAAGPTAERRPFTDGGENFPWLLDHRARALACLGRWDEAVRRRVQAARLTENGAPNVSQAINLAHLYAAVGRPAEALAALSALGPTSAYGQMEEQWARLRAHLQLRNTEAARAALAYLREHRDDALGVYQEALLDAGDAEGGAALLIERLADPEHRVDALESVQRYAESPKTPNGIERKARSDALLARPDVRAAIDQVGRIGSYPFLRPNLSIGE